MCYVSCQRPCIFCELFSINNNIINSSGGSSNSNLRTRIRVLVVSRMWAQRSSPCRRERQSNKSFGVLNRQRPSRKITPSHKSKDSKTTWTGDSADFVSLGALFIYSLYSTLLRGNNKRRKFDKKSHRKPLVRFWTLGHLIRVQNQGPPLSNPTHPRSPTTPVIPHRTVCRRPRCYVRPSSSKV